MNAAREKIRVAHALAGLPKIASAIEHGELSYSKVRALTRIANEANEDGEPLSIGRRSRSIPPSMQRALRRRDGGCRFPGCTNTRFVDGHHIKHWADGGETSLSNLIVLCRHHHHLVHEGGFSCATSSDGAVYFSNPDKLPIRQKSTLPGVANEREMRNWFDREFFEANIDSDTCNSHWHAGETMDWQMAVSALF